MQRNLIFAAGIAVGAAVLLGGCSSPPNPSSKSQRLSPATMVQAIRAAQAKDESVIQVTPLRDPSVNGYLDAAHAAEADGRYSEALDKINRALKLSPEAPDILQFRAEVEVLLKQFPAAAADARHSFQLGAKEGSLCAANWQTVLEIAEDQNDQAGVAAARKSRDACREAPPPSF